MARKLKQDIMRPSFYRVDIDREISRRMGLPRKMYAVGFPRDVDWFSQPEFRFTPVLGRAIKTKLSDACCLSALRDELCLRAGLSR